jgi:L-asparaginase
MGVELQSGRFKLAELSRIASGALTVLHGGAAPVDPGKDEAEVTRAAVRKMIAELSAYQKSSSDSRTIAEAQVLLGARLLEADPNFNAGYGAALQEDGTPRVSSGFMESTRQKCSAVINALEVKYPSELAYALQSRRFSVLDGQGAEMLARELGVARANLITPKRFDRWVELKRKTLVGAHQADGHGTIGAVSVSREGHLAAVTSTGGVGNETVGRVGDTPTAAGNYCTEKVAISCTGIGEQIIAHALAPRVAVRVDEGMDLEAAMRKSLGEADQRKYEFAAIAVAFDRARGEVHWCAGRTTLNMVWAVSTPEGALTF